MVAGNKNSGSYYNYGIYNDNGVVTLVSGRVNVLGVLTYGIYNKTGTLSLGIAEEITSINYGGANADVSITNPLIESFGTSNGIGIRNESGVFNYYDGKIVSTNELLPDVPSNVEYLYEPKEYIDDLNHNYCILKWMRETNG